ncbi:prolyl 3-hydroxylase 1 isoform X3 [Strongylocentrotus purpuratus]|uniref:procollagen-proline 3-dioxygenase n=1 Tax=Strongylocentrotus purpuratus TaxID=7668 RepID=A0A7M7PDH0_STRPU|nr:prolyl 3-hydroxylase 1 isoform X3 [Strongylocentrotus purpuratus]
MAQIISITSLFAFIFINYQLWRSVDSQLYAHLGDSFLDQEVTYDELYQSGMQSYTNEDWASTIFFFERALQEFDYFRASLTECRLKCQNVSHISSSGKDTLSELKVFEAVFKKADCTRRCKLKKLGGRSERIDDAVTDKFLSMTPYSYLQFAYYKSGLYEQAVAAAYTYLQWHNDDDVMQNNLDYYRNMHGIDDSQLFNLEEKWHHKYFLEGYEAHHNEKWHDVIKSMELALTEYWKADTQCRALCEGKYDNREFMDLYEAIAYHYASTLYCKSQCESWLSRINSKLVEDYLSSHFHFLQFAYYNVDDVQNAVKNALSFLILKPEDEVMHQNIAFYKGMKDPALEFTPRTDVERYHQLVQMENKMLQYAKKNFWEEDAEEFLNPDKDIDVEDETGPDYLGAEPIDPNEVNLKEGEEALLKEAIGHEMEKNSAKYSRDLNHNGGEASPGQPRHQDNGEAEFAQSDGGGGAGGGAGEMRSKILNGMKKVMKSLMGSSEEESEKLLLQLAKDPKSSEAKETIKVAIEKMMSSSDVDKALPREQLKKMMQGLTQGTLMDDPQGNGKRENFDPEAVGKDGKEMVFPSDTEGRMLDDKDYDPMKGLDQKEYFDWVNPPGFEAGAPGSLEADDQDDGDDDDDEDDAADQPDYHGNEDEDEEIIGDREYYPSDEDADEEELSENTAMEEAEDETNPDDSNHDDKTKDEFCLPGEGCGETSSDPTKYSEEQQTDPDQSQTEQAQEEQKTEDESNQDDGKNAQDEDEDDGTVIQEDKEENKENEIEDDDRKEDEGKGRGEHNRKEDEDMEREEDDKKENEMKNLGYLEGREHEREEHEEEEDEEECDWSCEEDDDGECIEEEEEEEEPWVYQPRELTPAEEKIQEALDTEVTNETKTWMEEMMKIDDNAYFLLNDLTDLEVVMTDDQLNGSNRVLADGLAADQECGTLLQLLDGEARQGNGYKGKTSPHTKFENFEGLTVKDAVDAASAGRIPLLYPTVYMHLAERSRQFLQRHFKLKSHLFFSYTHLVCRSAGPDSSLKRRDLSHPIHADNCQLDHKGVCHKRLPAFVWRDWSAILYLNQDFEGGEFIFAHYNNTAQAQVNPKCGRLVGFSAGEENLHGVRGVIHGRRCALAMWYTLDPRFREIEFFGAADHLNLLYEKEYKQQHA